MTHRDSKHSPTGQNEPPENGPPQPGQKAGRTMAILAWLIGIGLLTQMFGNWEEQQYNPNKAPEHASFGQTKTVTLKQNRWGHYVTNGQINQHPAVFMVDTGATEVAIPYELARQYNLSPGAEQNTITANGIVTVYKTTIDTLSIGNITLYNVRASLNPGMDKSQSVLLGMSVLKELELSQTQNELTLKQHF